MICIIYIYFQYYNDTNIHTCISIEGCQHVRAEEFTKITSIFSISLIWHFVLFPEIIQLCGLDSQNQFMKSYNFKTIIFHI